VNILVNLVAALVAYPLGTLLWAWKIDRHQDLTGLTVWTLDGTDGERATDGRLQIEAVDKGT
jgi:hypothetical protein